jgi:tripartite-type tricarboxylate transporter receptor subunit TctC
VPFSAGGPTDTAGRLIAGPLQKQLGQPIVIENKGGAGGTIGMAAVANAEPDGYTLLVTSNSFTMAKMTYPNLTFDPQRDFEGVMPIASMPMVLVSPPSMGYHGLNDLVAAIKKDPSAINYASAGAGGATHLGAERFRISAGLPPLVHIPYKGAPEAFTSVMTGRVNYYTGPLAIALPQIQAGKLTPLAMSSSKRSSALPDVPTTLEAGFPNSDYNVWVGVWVPAKTPRAIVERLNQEMAKAMQAPEVQAAFKSLVVEPMVMTASQFDTLVKKETVMNADLVKAAGITVN